MDQILTSLGIGFNDPGLELPQNDGDLLCSEIDENYP